MDSSKPEPEVAFEFLPLLRVYKNGTVERFIGTDIQPPSTDPSTGVRSKDVTVIPEFDVSARLYLPKISDPNRKLPLVLFFHGGAFCLETPFTSNYHNYLNLLSAEAEAIFVSVNYRKAPEHPIPAAYEDAWASLHWIASHRENGGPAQCLNDHADFGRVFLAGTSSGANIAHNLAMTAGDPDLGLPIDIVGLALEHPFFWGASRIGSEEASDPERKKLVDRLWPFVCPSRPNSDDPWVNPTAEGAPSLQGLGCRRLLVCVAEKDILRDRGRLYYESLGRSRWDGVAEIMETEGEDHGFHLFDLQGDNAMDMRRRLTAFFNREMPAFL